MKHIKPYFRRRAQGAAATSSQISYTPDQIAAAYGFPKVTTGTTQTIALIELGGGFVAKDIAAYFDRLNLPAPTVTAVSVNGADNAPGDDADGEVMLDILVAAAGYSHSTGKPADILVFFAKDQHFADAIVAAAKHPKKPAVCSISWGGPENEWQDSERAAMEAAFKVAADAGMTVLAAAGDNGSGDGERGKHVDYPASSPQVIACGGTSLHANATEVQSERVWNDGSNGGSTGGGFSVQFSKPSYQAELVKGNSRGVPDLAGDADPNTGYVVIVDGKPQVIGGTSAVAPLFAGLIAAICEAKNKRFGFINQTLYTRTNAFRDVTLGNNGAFKASTGWDPTTGLGVPVGVLLQQILT